MSRYHSNAFLANKVIIFVTFPSLWLKIITSFSVGGAISEGIFPLIYSVSDVVILLSVIVWWLLSPPSKLSKTIIGLVFILGTLNILTFLHSETVFSDQLKLLLKIVIPILFFMIVLEYTEKQPVNTLRLMDITIVIIVLCTLCAFLFFSTAQNRGEEWMPAYFSGLHTTSYVWVGVFFALFGRFNNSRDRILLWIVIFVFIGMSWGVRTAQGALIIFALLYAFSFVKDRNIKGVLLASGALPLLIMAIYLFTDADFLLTTDHWTSGRLSMYASKIEQLSNSGVVTLLVGGGVGSDMILTDIWWWAEKGSHNDYFTILVEQGFLFLVITIVLFVILIKSFNNGYLRVVLIVYLYTSMVSNGFMVRPLAAYLVFFAVCAYVAQVTKLNQRNTSMKTKENYGK